MSLKKQDFLHKNLYKESIDKYGVEDIRSLHWNSKKTQEIRFNILNTIGNFSGKTVLDLGCGKGDFLGYMRAKKRNPLAYVGVDFLQEFVDFAKQKYPKNIWICSDFFKLSNQKFDFIICNGALNVRMPDNMDFLKQFFLKFVPNANIALGLTLLKFAKGYINNPVIYTYSVEGVRKLLDSLQYHYEIIEGYIDNDFTVVIKNEY